MSDMVYQGTVWGPPFWNIFCADASNVLRLLNFIEIFYADDLNAFKAYDMSIPDYYILDELRSAQINLHRWGEANQVTFDGNKESFHILSRSRPVGDSFTILGITFDCKLLMFQSVSDYCVACNWKLELVLRRRRFF